MNVKTQKGCGHPAVPSCCCHLFAYKGYIVVAIIRRKVPCVVTETATAPRRVGSC